MFLKLGALVLIRHVDGSFVQAKLEQENWRQEISARNLQSS